MAEADELQRMNERTQAMLPVAAALDAEAKAAFESRSLPALNALHEKLESRSAEIDARLAADMATSACDVALLHLKSVVGDAINRLGGVARHVELSDDARDGEYARYKSYLDLCREDAGQAGDVQLTNELLGGISSR